MNMTHEILDWRMESGSASSEKYVIFTPSLKIYARMNIWKKTIYQGLGT